MKKKVIALGMAVTMALAGFTGCQGTNGTASTETEETSSVVHKIAIASYGDEDDEVLMFKNYYKEYLEGAFPVEFVYSPALMNYEEEKEFVDTAKEAGCEGIISFITYDLKGIVDYCGDDFYYMMGSGSRSEEEFASVKDKENFLGIVGPSVENEYEVGKKMMETLAGDQGDEKTYVLLSGGSALDNFMHRERLKAMLETLEAEQGFVLEQPVEELADQTEVTLAATSQSGGKVYLCPGYLSENTKADAFASVFQEAGKVDVVASTYYAAPFLENIGEQEKQQNANIQVGAVDCFCETNKEAFETEDAFGNSQLDFIGGKCAAMAAPSFVAMYNAVTDNIDTVRQNQEAFWLHQDFWCASSEEEFRTLYDAAINVYENVYGTSELTAVLKSYTEEADYVSFQKFVETLDEEKIS